MKGKFPVIKYLFHKEFSGLEDALTNLPSELLDAQTPKELSDILLKSEGGIVLFSLSEKKDIIEIGHVLKSLKTTLKETPFKVVIVNFSSGKSLEEKVLQLGIQDLISHTISQKVLTFKFDFWFRTLEVLVRPKDSSFFNLVDIEQDISERNDLEWLNSLHNENDIWILKSTLDLKKENNSWSVKVLGPGEFIGEWLWMEEKKWSFQFRGPEKTRFLSDEGNWFFTGERGPVFLKDENRWLFSGDDIQLYYVHHNEKLEWMNVKNGKITIRRNSAFALVKEDLIKDSFFLEKIKAWAFDNVLPSERMDSFLIVEETFFSCRFDDFFDNEIVLELLEGKSLENKKKAIFIGPVLKNSKERLTGTINVLEGGFVSLELDRESLHQMESIYHSFSEHQTVVDERLKKMKGL